MNNCLVTKLKGTVDNDNLNIFKQVTFKFGQTSGEPAQYALLATNGNGSVLITTSNGSIETDKPNPVPANYVWEGLLKNAESGLTEFTFDSCYNIKYIRCNFVEDVKGLDSLLYSIEGFSFPLNNSEKFCVDLLTKASKHNHFSFCGLAFSQHYDGAEDLALNFVNANKNTLKNYGIYNVNSLCSWFSDSTVLQSYSGGGNLEDLPVSIRKFASQDYVGFRIYGNINVLINKFIASGRVSGTIFFPEWPSAFREMTINNNGNVVPLADYMTSIDLNPRNGVYISWNAQGQITLKQGSAPQDYVEPDLPY